MADKLVGNVTLEVDEQGLEAFLLFKEDLEGVIINKESIQTLLDANKIAENFVPEKLDPILKTLKIEGRALIAQGIPPKQPKQEEVEWKDIAIPEDLKGEAEICFSMAKPVEIYQVKHIKEKKEKSVEKKGLLPFMKGKTGKVTYYEKKEIKEKLFVDPTVLETGYAVEGQVIAVIYAPEPGEPGVSIFGREIYPEEITGPAFYGGENVEISNRDIKATQTGFIRIGKNWIEILPFQRHKYLFELSKDKSTCFLTVQPGGAVVSFPAVEEVQAALDATGYPKDNLIDIEEIYKEICNSLRMQEALVKWTVSKDRDAEIEIKVSNDKVKALLDLRKGMGKGEPLSMKAVGQKISQAKLIGLDLEKLKKELLEFHQSSELELLNYPLTEGIAPERGLAKELVYSIPFWEDEKVESLKSAREESAFPLEHLSKAGYVDQGIEVAKISAAKGASSIGKSGKDVFGKDIPGIPGNDPAIDLGPGLRIAGDSILSTQSGVFQVALSNDVYYLRVQSHKDARIEVRISSDKMRAYVTIHRPEGSGQEIDHDDIMQALSSCKISHGIIQKRIEDALDIYASRGDVKDFLVAEGTPAAGSIASRIVYHIPGLKGADKTVLPIKGGQKILEVKSPQSGEEGRDVYDIPIPAVELEEFPLRVGKNIKRDSLGEDSFVLIAERAGELILEGNQLFIKDVFFVESTLDSKVGNVKFPGSVIVKGDINSGLYVMAGGDVQIYQGVGRSLVSADGSIIVKMGVRGAGKALLRAKKTVSVGFVEQATIMSVGNLNIAKSCLRSNIHCNGKIRIHKEKGTLIGGVTKTKEGLETTDLGSQSGIPTKISFGQDYLVEDRIQAEDKEIEKLKKNILQIDKIMKVLDKDKDKLRLDKIRKQKVMILKNMEKRTLRVFNLREKFEEHFDSEIIVKGTLFPGVLIESHGRTLEINSKKEKVRIYFEKETGRINIDSIR